MERSEVANRRFWKRCEAFQAKCFAAARAVKRLPPQKTAGRGTLMMLEELRMELAALTGNYNVLAVKK